RLQNDLGRHAIALREAVNDHEARGRLQQLFAPQHRRRLAGACIIGIALLTAITFYIRPAPAEQESGTTPQPPSVVAIVVHLTRLAPQIALAGTVLSRNDSHLA